MFFDIDGRGTEIYPTGILSFISVWFRFLPLHLHSNCLTFPQ